MAGKTQATDSKFQKVLQWAAPLIAAFGIALPLPTPPNSSNGTGPKAQSVSRVARPEPVLPPERIRVVMRAVESFRRRRPDWPRRRRPRAPRQ
jgi:hypothetical protein